MLGLAAWVGRFSGLVVGWLVAGWWLVGGWLVSPEKDEACSDDEHDLNGWVRKLDVVHVFAQKQGPAAAFGRILLAEHPDAKGLQCQPLVCRVHQNRCERQLVAHKA